MGIPVPEPLPEKVPLRDAIAYALAGHVEDDGYGETDEAVTDVVAVLLEAHVDPEQPVRNPALGST